MSTFSKLSHIAQYDDMIRQMNRIVRESIEEKEQYQAEFDHILKLQTQREQEHERDKRNLKIEIGNLEKDVKKLTRQVTELRTSILREAEDKKLVMREKKALLDQIKQVRLLVEKDTYGDTDAHRRRIIKSLDVDRLSPIQSDDSDDCVSGLDYSEDPLEADPPPTKTSRRSALHTDAFEHIHSNEQPTLPLYRYLDKNSENQDDELLVDGIRRSSRLAVKRRSYTQSSSNPTSATASSNSNLIDKYPELNTETDSNTCGSDEPDIEYVRQALQKEEAKRERLAAVNSSPLLKDVCSPRGMTLSAKSVTSLLRTHSNANTPVANIMKPHTFITKKSFKPENCGPCGGRVGFYADCVKCEICGVVSHPDCKEKCPLPCVKITAPNTRSKQRKILISDYVSSDISPKVPALIVHCCNEIERADNLLTTGLYRVVAQTRDVEDLQQKILKSKSGMPNLSKMDVHLLTGVVKRFLQSLDESLITTTLWSNFSEAVNKDDRSETIMLMKYFIDHDMPTANRETLSYLMQHFHAIANNSDKNMMSVEALARTLAPTIIGNSCRNPQNMVVQRETKTQIQIMEALFDIENDFWTSYVQKTPSTEPTQSYPRASLGSRLLLSSDTPKDKSTRSRASRLGGTLPTPRLKPLF